MERIIVTEPRAVVLPPVGGHEAQVLLPGENDVEEEAWAKAQKNPSVKVMLEAGTIEHKGASKEPAKSSKGMDGFTPAKAAAKLVTIEDLSVLKKLLDDTTKKTVRAVIESRIDEVAASESS
jgi:hypothetical protein